MIKNICLALLILISTGKISGQDKKFTVSGDIKGLESKRMYIFLPNETGKSKTRVDSIFVTSGKFSYTAEIDNPAFIVINLKDPKVEKRVKGGPVPSPSSLLSFYAEPGAKVNIRGSITDFVDAYPSGDATNDKLASLNKVIYPLMNKFVSNYVKVKNNEVKDPDSIPLLNQQRARLSAEVLALRKKFIMENPTSKVSAWLLEDMMIRSDATNEEAIAFFGKLDKKALGNFPAYDAISKRIEGIVATRTGAVVPAVSSSATPDGSKFELSSLKGKYVIVDFWGTWCSPCMEGMPKMKEYLNKYKGKLEIVGIAQESDDGTKWKATIKSSNLNWHHVLDTKDKKYVNEFNVSAFPTKFIIDQNGKILGKYLGESNEMYAKIDELMK